MEFISLISTLLVLFFMASVVDYLRKIYLEMKRMNDRLSNDSNDFDFGK